METFTHPKLSQDEVKEMINQTMELINCDTIEAFKKLSQYITAYELSEKGKGIDPNVPQTWTSGYLAKRQHLASIILDIEFEELPKNDKDDKIKNNMEKKTIEQLNFSFTEEEYRMVYDAVLNWEVVGNELFDQGKYAGLMIKLRTDQPPFPFDNLAHMGLND